MDGVSTKRNASTRAQTSSRHAQQTNPTGTKTRAIANALLAMTLTQRTSVLKTPFGILLPAHAS